MFRSFILRIALILSVTALICLFLMSATLFIQKEMEGGQLCGSLFLLLLVWFIVNWILVQKIDPELSFEVARMLLPAGMVLSILLSSTLSIYLHSLIPDVDGKQHLVLPFVGLGVAFYLLVRCFDLKWLRPEEEIASVERMSRQ
ncbi:MAG: hypothetical protein ACO3ZW_07720 [Opitutales bacterium]